MLIWYSQEARSYALLVLFGALSLLFFLRALRSGRGSDLALWSLFSALALCSHYFAFFPVAIEAAWLLLRSRGRLAGAIAAVGGVAAVGIALLPLLVAQSNPRHIGWIEGSPLGSRLVQSGVSFLIGETGHTIAEPPRPRYALVPLALVAIGMLILILRASGAEKREAARPLLVGLGVIALATAAALLGKDYVVERNLLPALVPLALVLAVAFGSSRARGLGLFCAGLLCAYWLAFDVYVDHTPNLQRPDFRTLTQRLGPPSRPRAIVTWRLAADPIRFYLDDGSIRIRHGAVAIREIDLITKPVASGRPLGLPAGFHPVARVRLDRLTLLRYMSRRPMIVPFDQLRDAPTGFGTNAVVADAPSPSAVPG
jgi:hypothetical protein